MLSARIEWVRLKITTEAIQTSSPTAKCYIASPKATGCLVVGYRTAPLSLRYLIFLSLVCRRLLEAKRASLLPHIWSFLITFPHSLNKILSSETCGFSCIRIASPFLSRTHKHAKCSYIIEMQNTLFLSQCFQKQRFQSQHFLKPVLPVGSREKKVYEADFCKAWCSSQ